MAAEVLSVADLVVEYPDSCGQWRPVVDGFSLAVRRGERVGLVGESGSGKSVAALAALGLVVEPGRMTGGTVAVGRIDLARATEPQLREIRGGTIGLVFQEPSAAVNPLFTVGFQIAETVRAHCDCTLLEAEAEARRLLDEVALDRDGDLYRAYPHQLSGGQLQRAMIALALAGRPQLVIADEPTTALDLVTQAQILALLDRLTSDGTALLLISHDLAVVAGLVERVVVMLAGREVENAPSGGLFERPLHPYTRHLLGGGSPGPRESARPSPDETTTTPGCAWAPRCALAEPVCRSDAPPMLAAGDGRAVRCPVVLRTATDPHGQSEQVR